MSVVKSQKEWNEFQVTTKALKLCSHTISVCNNKKIFREDKDFNGVIVSRIVDTSIKILLYCENANDILVRKGIKDYRENLQVRIKLQKSAIIECNNLLAYLYLAQKQFKFRAKKLKYWVKLTIETRDLITSWKNSDIKRF